MPLSLPREIAAFFDPLRAGIRAAAEETIGTALTLDFIDYPRLGSGDCAALEAAAANMTTAFCLFLSAPATSPIIRRIVAQGTPMVCVASDAPDTGRLGSVAVDAYTSGALAAELLSHKLQTPLRVATITGERLRSITPKSCAALQPASPCWLPHLTLASPS